MPSHWLYPANSDSTMPVGGGVASCRPSGNSGHTPVDTGMWVIRGGYGMMGRLGTLRSCFGDHGALSPLRPARVGWRGLFSEGAPPSATPIHERPNNDDPQNTRGVLDRQSVRRARDDLQSAHGAPRGARSPRRDGGDSRIDRDRDRSSRRG